VRVALQFETQESAKAWIHSPDGKEAIEDLRRQSLQPAGKR
jgi:hypothetical protein